MFIELNSVSYTYSPDSPYSAKALDNVSLKINKGEFVGIMGQTGCGKSTLVQLIAGLIQPDSGTVLFDGADIHAKKYNRQSLRQRIGLVFQFPEYQLFESTVARDVAFALKHAGLGKSEVQKRVHEALTAVGLDYDSIKDKSPLGFSGGEKRKIAIAGVLVSRPECLILDEPIAGLDPLGRAEFLQLLDRLNRSGTTIILISHNTDVLAEHAQRILVMENGHVLRDDKTQAVLCERAFLEQHGMLAGNVSDIVHRLRCNGADICKGTIRYEQLLDEICRIYGRDAL